MVLMPREKVDKNLYYCTICQQNEHLIIKKIIDSLKTLENENEKRFAFGSKIFMNHYFLTEKYRIRKQQTETPNKNNFITNIRYHKNKIKTSRNKNSSVKFYKI